jgi:hypothetical protein
VTATAAVTAAVTATATARPPYRRALATALVLTEAQQNGLDSQVVHVQEHDGDEVREHDGEEQRHDDGLELVLAA